METEERGRTLRLVGDRRMPESSPSPELAPRDRPPRVALVMAPVFGQLATPISLELGMLQGALRRGGFDVSVLDVASRVRDEQQVLHDELQASGRPGPLGGTHAVDATLLVETLHPGYALAPAGLATRIRASARAELERMELPGVACLYVCESNVLYAAALAQRLRDDCVPVVLVGPGMSVGQSRDLLLALGLADVALIGDGEDRIVSVVAALLRGEVPDQPGVIVVAKDGTCRANPGLIQVSLDGRPAPDLTGMGVERYGYIPVAGSVGCPHGCATCGEPCRSPTFRQRPAAELVAEMQALADRHGVSRFELQDAAANAVPAWLDEVRERLEAAGAPFVWEARLVAEGLSPGLGERLVRAGCIAARVCVGHLSERMLRVMGRDADVAAIEDAIVALARTGPAVQMDVTTGFPGETDQDHHECLRRLDSMLARSPRLRVSVRPFTLGAGSPVWGDPSRFGVELVRFQPGELPRGAERARAALSALVVSHRRTPAMDIVARRTDELLAVAGLVRDPSETAEGEAAGATGPAGKIVISVTSRCNQGCVFCNTPLARVDHAVSVADVAARVRASGATTVVLTGGEPTLLLRLPRLIEAARHAGAKRVVLETNATVVGAYPGLAGTLEGAGLDAAVVGLHYADPDESDKATLRPGSFELTLRGIQSLVDHGIPVTVRTVIFRGNADLAAAVPALLAERFGSRVELEVVPALGGGKLGDGAGVLLTDEQVRTIAEAVCDEARRLEVPVTFDKAS